MPEKTNSSDSRRQIIWGVVFSYMLIALNALYGLLVTPYIVHMVGIDDYGVYRTVASLSSSLMVVDLGLGGTVQRYIAKYIAFGEDKRKIGNYISMSLIQAALLSLVAAVICIITYLRLGDLYSGGLNSEELLLAKKIFIVFSAAIAVHLWENVLDGVITGYNRFIAVNGIRLMRIVLRILFTYVGLGVWKSPLLLVWLDFALLLFILLCEIIFIRFALKQRVEFIFFDTGIFRESFIYSTFMFISSLVNQVNSNLDNIVVGACLGSSEVAVYSAALTIFGMFSQIGSAVSGVLLPKVTGFLRQKDNNIEDYVVKIGRIQFMLIGAVLGAFIVLGKSFISVWMGGSLKYEFTDAYYISVILMIPAVFEICINVCLAVLRASNKLKYRTAVMVLMLCFNTAVTVFGVPRWGYFAAAAGTALSYIFGHVLCMNYYYRKTFKFHPVRAYRRIFDRTWICILLSSAAAFSVKFITDGDRQIFFCGAAVFIAVYAASLMIFLPDNERSAVIKVLKKFKFKLGMRKNRS